MANPNESAKKVFPVKKQLDRTATFKIKKQLEILIEKKLASVTEEKGDV